MTLNSRWQCIIVYTLKMIVDYIKKLGAKVGQIGLAMEIDG